MLEEIINYICKVMSIILIYIEMDINYLKLKIVFNLQTYKTFPDISVTLKWDIFENNFYGTWHVVEGWYMLEIVLCAF